MSEDELVSAVEALDSDESVNGILVQLPLPDHINAKRVLETVSAEKDVDGLDPRNVGLFWFSD